MKPKQQRSAWYTAGVPDRQIVAYYERVAEKILPLLRGRRVAVRHHFGSQVVFRRHWPDRRWITIPDKKTLLKIVRQHGYEFFPHLEGSGDFWFALDIDVRAVPLPLGKVVVRTALDMLDERGVKYLLKFSGGNGFHIHWRFSPRVLPKQKWQFARRIVRTIQQETENRLQRSPHREDFYRHIPQGDPITELNAMDKAAQKSVLFDELILKRNATIRAPFSLHMRRAEARPHGRRGLSSPLVAVPIEPRRLEAFQPATGATMARAGAMHAARMPLNDVRTFLGSSG